MQEISLYKSVKKFYFHGLNISQKLWKWIVTFLKIPLGIEISYKLIRKELKTQYFVNQRTQIISYFSLFVSR